MIGGIEPSETVRYVIVAWDTVTNTIDYSAEGMSCFDIAGVLAVTLAQAENKLPDAISETESEDEL